MKNNDTPNVAPIKKTKFRMLGAILILSLVFIGIGFSTARWITKTNGGNATTVAAFAATAGSDETSTTLSLSNPRGINTVSYNFWISNKENGKVSEVTNQYSITVTFSTSLPEGLTLDIDGTVGVASANRTKYTFSNNKWEMAAGNESKIFHALNFTANYDLLDENFTIPGIEIVANIEQVD